MLPVLFKKLGDHDPLFIVDFGSFLHMQVQESAVVFFYVMVRRYRDKQVPSGRSYFVFDISFFISGIRVAETDPETIVGTKTGEQLRFMDLIHDPAANAGSVVEYQEGWDASDVVEDIHKSLADTLRSLTAEHLTVAIVAVREGYREVFPSYALGIFVKISFSEINLSASGLPNEFLCAFCLDVRTDFLDELLDGVIASGESVFIPKAFVDSLGGVTLLGPVILVFLQPFRDDVNVRCDDRRSCLRHGRLR